MMAMASPAADSEKQELARYIDCAEYLIGQCEKLSHINGSQKLQKKCCAELKYLRSLSRRCHGYESCHLRSSNLSHYLGIVQTAKHLPGVTHILQAFLCPGRPDALHVDVVAGQGHIWVKVIARKAQALHLIWAGQGQFGDRDASLQAEDFITCSKVHSVNYVDPCVVFAFYNSVTDNLATALQDAGVVVVGEIVPVAENVVIQLNRFPDNIDLDNSSDDDVDSNMVEQKIWKTPIAGHSAQIMPCSDVDDNSIEVCGDVGKLKSDALSMSVSATAVNIKVESNAYKGERGSTDTSPELKNNQCYKSDMESHLPEIYVIEGVKSAMLLGDLETDGVDVDETTVKGLDLKTSNSANIYSVGTEQSGQLKNETTGKSDLPVVTHEILTTPVIDFTTVFHILTGRQPYTVDSLQSVNLDVTALITLVSAVSHGGCYFRFKEHILSEQAAEERVDPVLPKLNKFLSGKTLYACETAVHSFHTILDTLGGEKEKTRAQILMEEITVVKDNPSFRTESLPKSAKIKDRSKMIFGTGDSLGAVTVTANSGFVRAAQQQGVMYTVYLHASRALTETKEPTAEILSLCSSIPACL